MSPGIADSYWTETDGAGIIGRVLIQRDGRRFRRSTTAQEVHMRGFTQAHRRRRGSTSRSAPAIASVALLMAAFFAPTSFAAAPDPTYGSATVDGDPGEWDLTADFFAPMTNAGNANQPVLANLYVRYE